MLTCLLISAISNMLVPLRHCRIDGQDPGAVPGASTINTCFEVLVVTSIAKTATVCVFDGGDTGFD